MEPDAWYCPRCASPIELLLPVEPLYLLKTAALLVPTSEGALQRWIARHKELLSPPHYRLWKRRRYRYLTASDIRTMRAHLVSPINRRQKAEKRAQAGPV